MKNKRVNHKNRTGGIVFSTNENFEFETASEGQTLAAAEQLLEIKLEKKGRGGKIVSIISNFKGTNSDLKSLAKQIKNICGSGGSVKNGEIIIQGNARDKIMTFLKSKDYRVKRVGG